jgi:hypothetical protein
MRNGDHNLRVHIKDAAEPYSGCMGHDDYLVRQGDYIFENRPLMRCRLAQNRMGDDDGRDSKPFENFEHLVAVSSAVEAVFMLHDCHLTLVK